MAIRQIVYYPSEHLSTVSLPITNTGEELNTLIEDLKDTLEDSIGVGISAPQIGVNVRMFIIKGFTGEPIVFINPEYVSISEEEQTVEEGCLSLPGIFKEVSSRKYVVIKYTDEAGDEQEISTTDMFAACIQHEMDHLNGKVFTDRLNAWNRLLTKSAISNLPKNVE